MAVAFSAGGQFRSDFMISDAAMPMRMEEIRQEQGGEFADLLKNTGVQEAVLSESVPADISAEGDSEMAMIPDAMLLKKDITKIAKLFIGGKISVDDIPKELLAEVLVEAAKLKQTGYEFDEDEKSDENPLDKVNQILAAGLVEIPSDKSVELSEIAQAVTEQTAEVEAVTVQSEPVSQYVTAENIPQEQTAAVVQGAEITEEKPAAKQDVFVQKSFSETVQTSDIAEPTVIKPVESSAEQSYGGEAESNSGQSGESPFTAEQAAVLNRAAEKGEISKPVVQREQVQQVQPESEPRQAEQASEKAAPIRRERVVSVSDELEMLKNAKPAAKAEAPVKADAAQHVHTPIVSDEPVVLTRADGSQTEVKTSEILRQVTSGVLERTETIDEGKTEYSLVLNPEELGRITVKLTKAADGAVSVTIAAESSRTQRILEQNSSVMQDNLRSSGIRLESWQTVEESQQEAYAQDYNGSSKNPYYREEQPENGGDNAEDNSFAELIASM